MGRHKKPREQKRREGTLNTTRDNGSQPSFNRLENAPEPPEWVSDEAGDVFRSYGKQLMETGVLQQTDLAFFAAFCEEVTRYKQARQKIQEEGETIEERYSDGTLKAVRKSPYIYVAKDARDAMIKLGAKFGLSPSDRQDIIIDDEEEDDEFENL